MTDAHTPTDSHDLPLMAATRTPDTALNHVNRLLADLDNVLKVHNGRLESHTVIHERDGSCTVDITFRVRRRAVSDG